MRPAIALFAAVLAGGCFATCQERVDPTPGPTYTGGAGGSPAPSLGGAMPGSGGTTPADQCEQVRAHLAAPPLECPQADAQFVEQCRFWLATDPKSFDTECHIFAATPAEACGCGAGACCP